MKSKINFFSIIILIVFTTSIVCVAQISQKIDNSTTKFHNKIDDIKSASDIDKLLDSINKKQFEVFIIKENLEIKNQKCNVLAETIKAKSWTKADFDNNGYTDILIIGNNYGLSSIVVLDKGKNNFVVKTLTKGLFQDCSLPSVQEDKSQPLINYYSLENSSTPKVLTYKFGGFIEINTSPQNYKVEKLEYKTSICFGSCPSFELTIESNQKATYKAIAFNKKKKGTFKTKTTDSDFNEIVGLLNYIDFPNLNDNYSVGWTDDQSSLLKITYNNGKVKTIKDYGLIGTFGLSRVYEILFSLRENQNWK